MIHKLKKIQIVGLVVVANLLTLLMLMLMFAPLPRALAAGMDNSGPEYGQQLVHRMGELFASKLDDDYVAGSIALSNSEQDYTLPTTTEGYVMYTTVCAYGNEAYLRCGTAPVAATTSAGGYTFRVPEGVCKGPYRLTGPVCSHIAPSAAGHIVFEHFDLS